VWETLFWNDRVDRVYDLGAENVPGLLPRSPAEVQPDGTLLLPPSAPRPGPYAVASTGMTLLGDKVKSVKEQGLPQEGLILWRLDQSLRILTWTTDYSRTATLARPSRLGCVRTAASAAPSGPP
jgi:hypothetical protein